MSMKYMKLYLNPYIMGWLNFKWQWSVHWETKTWNYPAQRYDWVPHVLIVENRSLARLYKREHIRNSSRDRNVRIMRRRVQTNWELYLDSFTYSEKGNGNGR